MVMKGKIINVETALNGLDAFELVKKNQYDLILCDLNMPVMNGFICANKIKKFYD